MSINLKSFQKLFFIIFFSVISLSLMCSDELVHLPNKIAPELEKIEALPRRTKPAELNIEVTKIKSEVLNEVYIDRKSKNIYVDFSKKKAETLKNVKTIEDLENKYNLVVTETLKSSGLVKRRQKNKIMDNPPVMKYELATFEGEKVLKIPFENEPEKLYITVEESASKNIVKVYSLDIKNALTIDPRGIIETKTVIINLAKGIENYQQKKLVFDLNGNLIFGEIDSEKATSSDILKDDVNVVKESGFVSGVDGFINSFKEQTNILVNSTSKATKTTDAKSGDMQVYYQASNGQDNFVFNFYKGGQLSLRSNQINSKGAKSYTFKIIHTSTSGTTSGQIKEHTLIINSNIVVSKKEATVIYLNGYDIDETTFTINGGVSRTGIEVKKDNFTDGFINGLTYQEGTYITVQQIDIYGTNIGSPVSLGRALGDNLPTALTLPDVKITFLGNDGVLRLNMRTLDNSKSYRYKITHRNSNSSTGTVVREDILNIKSPESFVASIGQLDFGKIYKIGNPVDKTVTTNIELEYNSGTIQADYSLDVSQPNSGGSLTDSLYLNDAKTLLVKDLSLGSEITNSVNTAKRTLPLTGTIDGDSVTKTELGVYQKTIQILI
ncbi:MAG: hypothetical protein ACRC0Y_00530, partial [Fusobacteriaceae bacterium]